MPAAFSPQFVIKKSVAGIRFLFLLLIKVQPRRKESLLTCLADLFNSIATQKKKVGVIPPKKFISRLRKENGEFPYTLLSFCELSKY